MKQSLLKSLVFSILLLACSSAWSNNIDTILAKAKPPSGVVFEIVSGESGLLGQLLPSVKIDIKKLRDRFPMLPIAIVTHGTEQFDLTTENRNKETQAHKLVKELVNSNDVDIHVCGRHAEWYGITPEDFPDYVDVSAEGPAQINNYVALGYEVIILP